MQINVFFLVHHKKIDDQSLTEILGQEIENMAEKTVVLQKKKFSDKLRKKLGFFDEMILPAKTFEKDMITLSAKLNST